MNLDKFKTVEQLAAAIKSLDMVTSVPWTDYSGTSSITGWTSYTEKVIEYKKIGKLVFVSFRISGVSDSTSCNFTVPFAEGQVGAPIFGCRTINDTVVSASFGQFTAASTVAFYATISSGATGWNGGAVAKSILGQFWYETT